MSALDHETYNDSEDINLNYLDRIQDQPRESMTTVMGIKSSDGIIFASDTQATDESMKNLEVSKIFRINRSMGMGVSGYVKHSKLLIRDFRERLENSQFQTELDVRKKVDEILCELFKKHIVDRAKKLGIESTKYLFYVSAILCTKLRDETFLLHRLEVNPYPWVDLVEDYDYESIGSGELYVKLLMRQHNRVNPAGFSTNNISSNKWYAVLTMNEIKAFDSKTGGATQVAILDKNEFNILSNKDVREYYIKEREHIAKDTEEKQKQYGVSYERVYSYFPEP